jgi:hypothetical protein
MIYPIGFIIGPVEDIAKELIKRLDLRRREHDGYFVIVLLTDTLLLCLGLVFTTQQPTTSLDRRHPLRSPSAPSTTTGRQPFQRHNRLFGSEQ